MQRKRTIELVGGITTHERLEVDDLRYYASIDWKESASTAESLRKMVWSKEYSKGMDRTVAGKSGLNEDRDDIE